MMISAEIPDWSREKPRAFLDSSRKLLLAIRRYQHWSNRTGYIARLVCACMVIRHRFWSVISGADIPLDCAIGGGLLMPHPNGIVIHPRARIGVNCLIFQQVTIGTGNGDGNGNGVPTIGGHVDIGAGAKILGAVRIGEHVCVGANAVVLRDIPAGVNAVGVPARPVPKRKSFENKR